jgi:hypothetical protein
MPLTRLPMVIRLLLPMVFTRVSVIEIFSGMVLSSTCGLSRNMAPVGVLSIVKKMGEGFYLTRDRTDRM